MVPVKAIDSSHMRDNFSSHAEDYDRYASVQKRVVELLSRKLSGPGKKTRGASGYRHRHRRSGSRSPSF